MKEKNIFFSFLFYYSVAEIETLKSKLQTVSYIFYAFAIL